jgi:hypothetical protein
MLFAKACFTTESRSRELRTPRSRADEAEMHPISDYPA